MNINVDIFTQTVKVEIDSGVVSSGPPGPAGPAGPAGPPAGVNFGAWDADTNTPTIVNGIGTEGDWYTVSVAGATVINGSGPWSVGDQILFSGGIWTRVEGAVTNKADLDGGNIPDADVQPFRASIGVSAPTLTALKTAKVTDSIFVSGRNTVGDGYAGTFEWQSGDQYAGVFNDPLQGIWVAPTDDPTASLGAWKRVFDGPVNPVWFGAGAGGDDTAAFSAAARMAKVSNYIGGGYESGLIRPDQGYVTVTAGNYSLSSVVDTFGRSIVWILDYAAVISNIENINGKTVRGDNRISMKYPFGISDNSTAFAATTGGLWSDRPAPVTGVMNLQQLANYNDRDSVGVLGGGYSSKALVNASTATYTATTCTFTSPSADTIKRLRRGMIIDTKHATRCTALISSWSVVGANLVVTVAEWRARGGSAAVTPANGTGLYVSRTTKVWGGNFIGNLAAGDDTLEAIGIETSIYNVLGNPSTSINDATNRIWGNYVFSAGPFNTQASYMCAGLAHYGYVTHNSNNGFYAYGTRALSGSAYIAEGGYSSAFVVTNTLGQRTLWVGMDGNMELGNKNVATQPYIDFHSSGDSTVDYDARISSIGGSNVPGAGTLVVNAQGLSLSVSRIGFFGSPTAPRASWGAPTGTGSRLTFNTDTVTLPELAARVRVLIDDLRAYGLLGTI